MNQVLLGDLALIAFGIFVAGLLGLMLRYEAKTGKALYWWFPGRRITLERDPGVFKARQWAGGAIFLGTCLVLLLFIFHLVQDVLRTIGLI